MIKNKDIALRSGVSVATVSRVMNQSGYVKEETKDLVLKAFNELVNEDQLLVQTVSNGKTNLIGVIVPDISNPFFGEVIKGISSIAEKHTANLLLCNTEEQLDKEIRYLELFKTNNIKA